MALTRFRTTLRRARLSVRQLTHTLHLPPALSEIYGGPNSFWLRDILENLPKLQSLLVSQLPFFDHQSLIALRHPSSPRRPLLGAEDEPPQYDLRLLLAEREPNTTSAGLVEALFHFPHLVYLDLSYTTPARDPSVLSALANLWDLQVLKLRGIGMRDADAEILANALGIRVRLLDLRDNRLTDMAVRSLMQACFLPPGRYSAGSNMNSRQIEDWPVGMPPAPDFWSLDPLRSEDLDRELLKQLTHPLTGRLAFEDLPHKGLTHLYIANNNLTINGLSSLLKSTRLHILDAGSVDTGRIVLQTGSLPSSANGYPDDICFPGAEKLVPMLVSYASHNLTYLRISHAVVTKPLHTKEFLSPAVSAVELASERTIVVDASAPAHYPVELPSENEAIFEFSAETAAPKYELPGDSVHFALSPPSSIAQDQDPATSFTEKMQPKRGDGAFDPEDVADDSTERIFQDEVDIGLNASGSGSSFRKPAMIATSGNHDLCGTEVQHKALDRPTAAPQSARAILLNSSAPHLAHINILLRKRLWSSASALNTTGTHQTDCADSSLHDYTYLHPSQLPNLRTLVLTDIPAKVPASSPTLTALLRFISACADEEHLALLRAQTDSLFLPGYRHHAAEMQHAHSLFALRTIILEISNSTTSPAPVRKAWDHSRAKYDMLKSSTGDRDTEALWSAAENDFSFFGEEGEEENEYGIYQDEPEKHLPTASINKNITSNPEHSRQHNNPSGNDVIGTPPLAINSSTTPQPARPRSPTPLQNPSSLPLGRDRRPDTEASNKQGQSIFNSASTNRTSSVRPTPPGTIPTSSPPEEEQPFRSPSRTQPPIEEPMLDLVAELAKFRRQKKKEYEDALIRCRTGASTDRINHNHDHDHHRHHHHHHHHSGTPIPIPTGNQYPAPPIFVEGHWNGEIKIVRNATPRKAAPASSSSSSSST